MYKYRATQILLPARLIIYVYVQRTRETEIMQCAVVCQLQPNKKESAKQKQYATRYSAHIKTKQVLHSR